MLVSTVSDNWQIDLEKIVKKERNNIFAGLKNHPNNLLKNGFFSFITECGHNS